MKKRMDKLNSDVTDFNRIYNKYCKLMYVCANKILNNHALAEEAVSETFLSIYKSFTRYKLMTEDEKLAFLHTVVRNQSLNLLKKEDKQRAVDMDYYSMLDNEHNELSDVYITDCIKQLPKTYQEVLYMRYVMGFGYNDIAVSLGISPGAVRKRIQYAKAKLTKILKDGGSKS